MASQRTAVAQDGKRTREYVRALVQEIQNLCERQPEPEFFFREVLQRIAEAMAAAGGAVWLAGDSGRFQLAQQMNLPAEFLDVEQQTAQDHWRLVQSVAAGNSGRIVKPHTGGVSSDGAKWGNASAALLILNPVVACGKTVAVIEILVRSDSDLQTQQSYLRFLREMCGLLARWSSRRELQSMHQQHALWGEAQQFVEIVHRGLDRTATAFAIASEARRLVKCDRVSVAVISDGKSRIEAVSGQDVVDPRSNVVTGLRKLSQSVAASGEELWYRGAPEDLPPQIESQLDTYVEESHATTVIILPLRKPLPVDYDPETPEQQEVFEGEVFAALVLEKFGGVLKGSNLKPRIALLKQHSAQAMSNSLTHSNLFLMPLWRTLSRAEWMFRRRTLPKTIAACVAAAIAMIFLCLPAEFELETRGVLQPVVRKNVFARTDGVVTQVHVHSGATVKKGQKLVTLNNTNLDLALQKNNGDQLVTLKALNAIRDSIGRAEKMPGKERTQLFGEHARLKIRHQNLIAEQALLDQKKASLVLVSPVDGIVTTWNVRSLLSNRPVATGQKLVTVADPDRGWELELFMPESRMGHVLKAGKRLPSGESLAVDYILASEPSVTRSGKVARIQPVADLHGEEGHAVKIVVGIDPEQSPELHDPRPGATVIAGVHCGVATRGYVWFHEAYEWVLKNVWF